MPTVFEIFYIDRNTGWAIAEFTADTGDQVGEARFLYRKAEAIAEARRWDPDKPVRIFDRHGRPCP